jgi:redox-sensitive bicupin YhaK (pirin superfamily)
MENSLMQILSPFKEDEGVWIHQNAWFHMGRFDEGKKFSHALNDAKNNGLYAMVIDGKYKINGTELSSRDALGIWDTETVEFETITTGRILLMEVPMQLA